MAQCAVVFLASLCVAKRDVNHWKIDWRRLLSFSKHSMEDKFARLPCLIFFLLWTNTPDYEFHDKSVELQRKAAVSNPMGLSFTSFDGHEISFICLSHSIFELANSALLRRFHVTNVGLHAHFNDMVDSCLHQWVFGHRKIDVSWFIRQLCNAMDEGLLENALFEKVVWLESEGSIGLIRIQLCEVWEEIARRADLHIMPGLLSLVAKVFRLTMNSWLFSTKLSSSIGPVGKWSTTDELTFEASLIL